MPRGRSEKELRFYDLIRNWKAQAAYCCFFIATQQITCFYLDLLN